MKQKKSLTLSAALLIAAIIISLIVLMEWTGLLTILFWFMEVQDLLQRQLCILMGKEDGLPLVKQIFDKTLSEKARREHKHYNDDIIGASPHIIKCTRYNGQTLQMGMCHIRIV